MDENVSPLPAVEEVADLEAAPLTGEQAAPGGQAPETEKVKAARSAQAPRRGLLRTYMREIYGLLALLSLWLIARIYEGSDKARPRREQPTRRAPISAEELGRTMFSVARGEDFDAYRLLYLSGSEAFQVLGPEEGQRYIGRRTLSALEAAFDVLAEQVPHGTLYVRSELQDNGQCVMYVKGAQGKNRAVSLGSVAHIGAVMRVVEPGIGLLAVIEDAPDLSEDAITELQA